MIIFVNTPKMGGTFRMPQRVCFAFGKSKGVYPEVVSSADFPREIMRDLKVKNRFLYESASRAYKLAKLTPVEGHLLHSKAVFPGVLSICKRVNKVKFDLVVGGVELLPELTKQVSNSRTFAVTIRDDVLYKKYLQKSYYGDYEKDVAPHLEGILAIKNYMIKSAEKHRCPVFDYASSKFPPSDAVLDRIAGEIVRLL